MPPIVSISVNGVRTPWAQREISYDQVCEINEWPGGRAALYTIVYHVPRGRSGTLTPGQAVKVEDGMLFTAAVTDNA